MLKPALAIAALVLVLVLGIVSDGETVSWPASLVVAGIGIVLILWGRRRVQ